MVVKGPGSPFVIVAVWRSAEFLSKPNQKPSGPRM